MGVSCPVLDLGYIQVLSESDELIPSFIKLEPNSKSSELLIPSFMKCYAILDLRYRTGVCLVRPFVVPCPVSRSPHPFKMRVGCGPVGAERVCDRLATQNGCTGWKGRCGGSGPPGRGGGG